MIIVPSDALEGFRLVSEALRVLTMNTDGFNALALPSGIIVMRHGHREDADNPGWQAHARFPFDTPLAANENEIHEASKQLQGAGRTFDVVYTSPFLRCLETAERLMRAMGRDKVPIFVHKGLSEVHNPHLIFKTSYPSVSQRLRFWLWRSLYRRISRPTRLQFTNKARVLESTWPTVPESEGHAAVRFQDVILELATKHPGQTVLIVSHGKSVQVTHELLGGKERVQQVGFAGFISCCPKTEQEEPSKPSNGGTDKHGARWTDFTFDPQVPYFNVDFYT